MKLRKMTEEIFADIEKAKKIVDSMSDHEDFTPRQIGPVIKDVMILLKKITEYVSDPSNSEEHKEELNTLRDVMDNIDNIQKSLIAKIKKMWQL